MEVVVVDMVEVEVEVGQGPTMRVCENQPLLWDYMMKLEYLRFHSLAYSPS